MTDHGPISRLGVYQRAVAFALEENVPLGIEGILSAMEPRGPAVDTGYAMATMQRLVERGIAKHYGQTMSFVRGHRWNEAADYYGWNKK